MDQLTSEAPPIDIRQMQEIIHGAQSGRIEELSILAKIWHLSIFIPLWNQSIGIFLHHLYSSDAPAKPKRDARGIIEDLQESRAFWSLWGLALLSGPLCEPTFDRTFCVHAIIRAWPGVFKWSAFFYASRVHVPSTEQGTNTVSPDICSMRGILRDVIAACWATLAIVEPIRKTMLDTRGVVRIAAGLWIFEDAPGVTRVTAFGDGIPTATMLLDFLSRDGNQETIKDIIAAAGGDIGKIAHASIRRLKKTFKSSEFEANPVESVLVLDFTNRLCRSPDRDILNSFLDNGVIPVCIKLLLELATVLREGFHNTDDKDDFVKVMLMDFRLLRYSLLTTKGLRWVQQAIKTGLLSAFVECSPFYADLEQDEYTHISTIFTNIIPRYLAYLPIVQATDSAFLKMEKTERFLSLRNARAWDAFNALALVTARRFRVIGKQKEMQKLASVCANPKCHKVDIRETFKQCTGCRMVLYCSRECQLVHWKELGHRKKCKEPAEAHALEDGQVSDRDWQYILSLNLCEVRYNLEALKHLAATNHAGIPFDDLVVVIDYNVVPTGHFVERLSCWNKNQPRFFPKDEDDSEESRASSYVITIIPGEGLKKPIFHLTPIPGDFWQTDDTLRVRSEAGVELTINSVVELADKEAETRRQLYLSV